MEDIENSKPVDVFVHGRLLLERQTHSQCFKCYKVFCDYMQSECNNCGCKCKITCRSKSY